jgi:hypothetical protein
VQVSPAGITSTPDAHWVPVGNWTSGRGSDMEMVTAPVGAEPLFVTVTSELPAHVLPQKMSRSSAVTSSRGAGGPPPMAHAASAELRTTSAPSARRRRDRSSVGAGTAVMVPVAGQAEDP